MRRLISISDNQRDRRAYQLARYLDDVTVSLQDTGDYNYNVASFGFAQPQDSDLAKPGSFSVIRSCVDSLVSKIASNKVRPYVHPINGTYKAKQVTRQVRQYLDVVLDTQDLQAKVTEAFRQAVIFDTGYLFINPFTYEIETPSPWTVAMFNMEAAYGKNKSLLIKRNNYPESLLDKKYRNGMDYCQYVLTVDLDDHKCEIWINGEKIDSKEYKPDILPIVPIYYSRPLYGRRTYSLVDALEGIQEQIDLISTKIAASAEMTSGNTTYVVEGSSLKAQDINNRTGNIYTVKMPAGTSTIPVMNVTPPALDPSWTQLLQTYIDKAYEITGISKLSAQSKKPSGLDSGTALATMEDIESERFQTQLDNYIQSFKDVVRIMIEVLPDDADILPSDIYSSPYKWKDIKKLTHTMRINFAADSALSKDPSEKLKQISQISQIGAIDINELIQQLDSTDLEGAYKEASSKINAIEKCLENAIEYGDYSIPAFVSYQDLYKKVLSEESQLYSSLTEDEKANEEVQISLLRLETLEQMLLQVIEENGYIEDTQSEDMTAEESGMTGVGSNEVNGDINADVQALETSNQPSQAAS